MRKIILKIQDPAPLRRKKAPPILSHVHLNHRYFPRGGIFYSLLLHEIAFISLLYIPELDTITEWSREKKIVKAAERIEPEDVIYLPMFEPGKDLEEPALEVRNRARSADAAQVDPGLSYPGRQSMVSNPPDPTNFIQTILQPRIEKPQILPPPVLVPNVVLKADAGPVPMIEPPPEEKPPVEIKPPEIMAPLPKAELPKITPLSRAPAIPAPDKIPVPKAPDLPPPDPASLPRMQMPSVQPLPRTMVSPVRENLPLRAPVAPDLPAPDPAALPRAELPKVEPLSRAAARPVPGNLPAPPPPDLAPPDPASLPRAEIPNVQPLPRMASAAGRLPAPKILSPAPPPKTAGAGAREYSPVATSGPDAHNLVALTPIPAATAAPVVVPAGEARGQFAISPKPNLAAPGTSPESRAADTPPAAGAAARPAPISSGRAATTVSGNASRDNSADAAAKDKSAGAVTNAATARGTGGLVVISGSNATSGSGSGAFAGITITGGVREPGIHANAMDNRAPRPLQTAYGLTVISTENSGGGLPYFGVFSQEQVYTVYLDVREAETEMDPTWTLEFAVLPDEAAQASQARSQEGLVLPFPTVKPRPALSHELLRKHLRKMIVVFGIINLEGKMEQLSIKDSPDPLFNAPVLDALGNWMFRPARLNGAPVRVKVLLGVPLWLPE